MLCFLDLWVPLSEPPSSCTLWIKKLHLGIIGLKGDHQWKWLPVTVDFLEACQPEENCWHWEQPCQDQPGLGPRSPIYQAFAAFKWVLLDTEGPYLSLAFTLGIHSFLLSRGRGIVGRRAPASTWEGVYLNTLEKAGLWKTPGFGLPSLNNRLFTC